MPNFTVVAFKKYVGYSAQNHQSWYFRYKFAQNGYIPLSDFYKIWERVPGPRPHAKLHRCGFKNVGLQPPKSRKIVIFGINLFLRENFGVHRKS